MTLRIHVDNAEKHNFRKEEKKGTAIRVGQCHLTLNP